MRSVNRIILPDGSHVADKRYSKATPRSAHAYTREVTCLRRLAESRYVIPLTLNYVDDDAFHVCTPWCHGGSAPSKRIHAVAARKIALDVLRGIRDAHSHGIVHGDIKPDNIVGPLDGTLRLIDFEDAQLTSNVVRASIGARSLVTVVRGSVRYMSPETLSSIRVPANDVWSTGVTVFIMLTGCFPFDDPNGSVTHIWYDIMHADPRLELIQDPVARDFVKMCLIKHHTERAPVNELLLHPWFDGVSS